MLRRGEERKSMVKKRAIEKGREEIRVGREEVIFTKRPSPLTPNIELDFTFHRGIQRNHIS